MKKIIVAIMLFYSVAFAAPDLVTVSDKVTGNELSAVEFNQILDALKSGSRSATVQSVIINGVQGWFATGLEGATSGDLATIPVAKIKDKAIAVVNVQGTGVSYLYYFSAAGTNAESVPSVIRPNDYATAGVWKLATPILPDGTTATTQLAADNSTKLATTAYADAAAGARQSALVNSNGLAGAISDETGSGAVVFGTSPAFTTDIHAATAGGATLGTNALPFSGVRIGNAATNNILLTGTSASDITVTLPSAAGTLEVTTHNHSGTYQPADTDLTSIAGGVTGMVKGAGNGGGYSAATSNTDYLTPVGPVLNNGNTGPGYIDFKEDSDNGTNYTRIIATALLGGDYTQTLQDRTGTIALTQPYSAEYPSGGTLTDRDVEKAIITNYGQGGTVTINLPAYAGRTVFFITVETTGQTLYVKPPNGESLVLDGTTLTADYKITGGTTTAGDSICLRRIRTGASTYKWFVEGIQGAWASAGAV